MIVPLHDSTVEQAIKEFYHRNNIEDDGGVTEKFVWIKFGFLSFPIPNFESRKRIVYMHDVSHIVTGFDSSWKGESAVSSWEIASGGWGNLYFPWLLTLWAMGVGVLVYPGNVLTAFRQGLSMKNALTCRLSKEELLESTVAELQEKLTRSKSARKNPYLWMGLSLIAFVLPFITGLLLVLVAINFI